MGWKLVELDREETKTDPDPDPIVPTVHDSSEEETTHSPDWYTEEDRKVAMVLSGSCNNCSHLRMVYNNSGNYNLKGVWCSALRKRLEYKVENCDEFYSIGDEIEKLIKNMGINNE